MRIIGISTTPRVNRILFSLGINGVTTTKQTDNINAYLVPYQNIIVSKRRTPISTTHQIEAGGKPVDGGNLFMNTAEKIELSQADITAKRYIMRAYGADEYTNGKVRFCLWISDEDSETAREISFIHNRLELVAKKRKQSPKPSTKKGSDWPYRFEEVKQNGSEQVTLVPTLTSETREYIPAGLLPPNSIVNNLAFALYNAPLWSIALIASRMHFIWIATVCGKFKNDVRYSNTLGWNSFPFPQLTDQNKTDLTRCAEEILLARENYFPATIADMYAPDRMDTEFPLVREAHDRNDEVLERIYIGRRFKNDTERLEKLFDLYTKMTSKRAAGK